jgi:hypothetical protein
MSARRSRREFLADVGRGTLIAAVGSTAAADLGIVGLASAGEPAPERLTFGELEGLVALMQETPADRIVPAVIAEWKRGTDPKRLVAAAALANARTFGGEDYVGFHTLMAMAPAYHMSRELPEARQLLPIVKVIYRNARRIQEFGGRSHEVLHPVEPAALSPGQSAGETLRDNVRGKDMATAERTFAALATQGPEELFNDVLFAVQDNTEVHRTVLPYRAWDLLSVIGLEYAHTLLRQSVHYCVKAERESKHTPETDKPRLLLPKLLDQYHLVGKPQGTRSADDAWVEHLSKTIFEGTGEQAADAAAAALAEGMAPEAVGEAISLAANQLILRDAGRRPNEVQDYKPLGSVHGDSIGVHACDSANAWRNMAKVSNPRNTAACLILGAYQVAYDRVNRGGDFLQWSARPAAVDVDTIREKRPEALLEQLDSAIRAKDQEAACSVVYRLSALDQSPRNVFDRLLGYAVSEDGALHAEKYYRTVSEEFAATRPAFRWRQLLALARVTASEYGRPAAGVGEARERLGIV